MLISCGEVGEDLGKDKIMSFQQVEERFEDPGKDFRPAPLWTWNTKVTHEDIDRMLSDFKEQGFGGAFVHPRPGLVTEYLSDDWFELWRYSVEKGKELGLDIWIYDENSYPSGFAGGHVQEAMPESYDHTTNLIVGKYLKIDGSVAEKCSVCLKKVGEDFIDITENREDYYNVDGEYYLYTDIQYPASQWTAGFPYVDLLYPGVTEKFIEVTMSGYEKEFGKELGPVVKGIFTDEPHVLNWTPAIFEEFQKDWGYDLHLYMPMLLDEITNWKQVRYHFNSTKLRLFIEHWSKPWDKYCREHGMLWTGHYWEHCWPRLNSGGDNMAMYAFHHMPGIDMLFNGFDEKSPFAQWGNVRSVKELRSVANQMGYTRTLCESYGGGGWAMTFEDFKRLADWEYALGVNFMNQHYSNITTEGARKYDYPDFFTGYSPWGEDYKTLNDYVARLSLVLSQGEQNNDILILEPTTTVWMYYTYRYNQKHVDEIGSVFQEFVTELEHRQLEYDLGCETIIKDHGKVARGKFIVGGKAYSTVIIPEQVEVLLPRTAELLEEFSRQGGRIIALSKPELADAYEDEGLKELWAKGGDNILDKVPDDLFDNASIKLDDVAGGILFHHRREYDDGQLLFLVNSSKDESCSGKLTVKGSGLKMLDAMSGEQSLYASVDNGDGTVSCSFDLPAAGSLLLFAPEKPSALAGLEEKVIRKASGKVLSPTSGLNVERIGKNWLTLDFCTVTVDGETGPETFVADACQQLFRRFGMENPWEEAVQFRTEVIDRDTISTGDITVEYCFDIAEDFDWSSMKLVCEKPWLWEVSVNGNALTQIEGEHPLDARNGTFAIGGYVHKGRNVAQLHIPHMSLFAEVAHAFVNGDFSVVPTAKGWEIRAPHSLMQGSWPAQGLPFYSWGVSYSQKYNVSDPSAGHILKLGSWKGTECEVFVNGVKTGIIAYKPYELDVTPFLNSGENEIKVVCIGSLANLYGPHYSPRAEMMSPRSWYGIKERRGGADYVLDDYGLKEPFELWEEQ